MNINTFQNVAIEYETASLRLRGIAFAIDQVILFSALFIISALIYSNVPARNQDYAFILINLPLYLFYTPTFEILNNGQTPGKAAMRLRVIKTDGSIPAVTDYILRWCFRLIDIFFSTGIVAAVSITSSPINQRLGGYVSNTMVIKKSSDRFYRLEEILSMNKESLKTKYDHDALLNFTEEEMLTFKEAADRYEKYPNPDTQRALHLAVEIMTNRLGIKEPKEHPIHFIRSVIKDYVIATR